MPSILLLLDPVTKLKQLPISVSTYIKARKKIIKFKAQKKSES